MGARGGQEQLRNPGLTLATGREQLCRIRGGRPAGLLDAKFFRIHPGLSAEACGLGGRAEQRSLGDRVDATGASLLTMRLCLP